MHPVADIRDISSIAYGFIASKVLFATLNLDIFSRLANNPKTLAILSQETGIAENRLLMLLTACVSLGLLTQDGERYANTTASETYLVREAPAYFGDYFRFQVDRQLYPGLEQLDAALQGESVSSVYDLIRLKPSEAEHFSQAQHIGSLGPAHVMAKHLDLSQYPRFLDVAGGSGAFTITFCRRYPELKATILDFPNVIEIARRFVTKAGLEHRIEYLAGDALEVAWPHKQDAVLMSYLLSAVSRNELEELIRRASEALEPGGILILHDFIVEDDRTGPPIAALFAVGSVIINADSVLLTPQLLSNVVRQNCFEQISVRDLIPGITKMMTAIRSIDCP